MDIPWVCFVYCILYLVGEIMKFAETKGRKGEEDLMLLATSKFREVVTMDDVLYMIEHFFRNEDKVYNSDNCQGGSMFLKEVIKVFNKVRHEHDKPCVEFVENFIVEYKKGKI